MQVREGFHPPACCLQLTSVESSLCLGIPCTLYTTTHSSTSDSRGRGQVVDTSYRRDSSVCALDRSTLDPPLGIRDAIAAEVDVARMVANSFWNFSRSRSLSYLVLRQLKNCTRLGSSCLTHLLSVGLETSLPLLFCLLLQSHVG